VTFNVDVNGISRCPPRTWAPQGKQDHRPEPGGLSKDEIEKMKREAEAHAAEDKKRREVIELKNQGENLAYQTEKSLKDYGEKVSGDVRGEIESALSNLREALRATKATASRRTMDNLTQVSHKLAEEMYKASAPAGGAGPTGEPGPGAAPTAPPRARAPHKARRTRTSLMPNTK